MARIGCLPEARTALHQSLDHARALGLQHHAVSCLDLLIRIELQLGDQASVALLIDQLRSLVAKTGWGIGFLENAEVAHAWLTHDVESAARLRGAAKPPAAISLPAVAVDAADRRVALSFAFPELLDNDTVTTFLNQPVEARNRGCLDIWMAAGADALFRLGRLSDSQRILAEYWRNMRPESDPPSPALLQRVPDHLARHMSGLHEELMAIRSTQQPLSPSFAPQ